MECDELARALARAEWYKLPRDMPVLLSSDAEELLGDPFRPKSLKSRCERALSALGDSGALGLDSEWDALGNVALLQLATRRGTATCLRVF